MNKRYMIIAADDFGRSRSVNLAIAEAHDRGIVTAASMMAGGEAFDEAVRIALERENLSVGLHVTLCDGRSVLPHRYICDLVDAGGLFERSPVRAGLKYAKPGLRLQLEMEIEAQFDRLEKAGIRPAHVDGHHHLHMHPVVFPIMCRLAARRGIKWVRFPREPLHVVLKMRSASRGLRPFIEWALFGTLRAYNMRTARTYGLRPAPGVYGLARTGAIDEESLAGIVDSSCERIAEVFTHPDTATIEGRRELGALTSPGIRERIKRQGVDFVGYRELAGAAEDGACAGGTS